MIILVKESYPEKHTSSNNENSITAFLTMAIKMYSKLLTWQPQDCAKHDRQKKKKREENLPAYGQATK
jgi:hypothetical protein